MVELAGVILTLSMEVLVGGTFAQSLKTFSREIMAWPGFYKFIVARKLHCLTKPIYSRVSAPIS